MKRSESTKAQLVARVLPELAAAAKRKQTTALRAAAWNEFIAAVFA